MHAHLRYGVVLYIQNSLFPTPESNGMRLYTAGQISDLLLGCQ